MDPLVSVIIPNYNYARYLSAAIESALAQTYKKLEVIVVDDGSTDDSLQILESFGDKISVVRQANAGVAVARNVGTQTSKGDYLAFLDPDDLWHPTKIEEQIEVFLGNPRVGLVHVGQRDIDAAGRELGTHIKGSEGNISDELLVSTGSVILGGGSGLMVTRQVFEEAGGFDPRLSTCADWDLFYQIALRSEVRFISKILLDYRYHGSNMHGDLDLTERDAMLCLEKVFSDADPRRKKLKRRAYGKFHVILSGSNFHAGRIYAGVLHGLKTAYYDPRRVIAKLFDLLSVRSASGKEGL